MEKRAQSTSRSKYSTNTSHIDTDPWQQFLLFSIPPVSQTSLCFRADPGTRRSTQISPPQLQKISILKPFLDCYHLLLASYLIHSPRPGKELEGVVNYCGQWELYYHMRLDERWEYSIIDEWNMLNGSKQALASINYLSHWWRARAAASPEWDVRAVQRFALCCALRSTTDIYRLW